MSISSPEGANGISFENIANKIPTHVDYDNQPVETEDTTNDEVSPHAVLELVKKSEDGALTR